MGPAGPAGSVRPLKLEGVLLEGATTVTDHITPPQNADAASPATESASAEADRTTAESATPEAPTAPETTPTVQAGPAAQTRQGPNRPPDRRPRRPRRGRGRPRRRRGPPHQHDDPIPGGDREPGELLGILEVLPSGSGFIRRAADGYVPGKNDIYVGSRLIHRFGLRTGDELAGIVGRRPRNGKSPPLRFLDLVNGLAPDSAARRPDFNRLSAMHPREQLRLECGRFHAGEPDMTNRVVDLFCPMGKGQRAMIVAPAKAGKTTILQAVAEGVEKNHPECELIILLVDERPEEVTEMEMCGFGEVIASTFDLTPERHCQVAEMTLARARRRVEAGKDVVIILDSITRLARAHNTGEEGSGRTLSGGLDASSLEKPKRFLGSAR
ncbi:MAG: transcription termination factor Rho, partial [Boseongicola sp. SB0677_bin_26]|nr:transcription termination factor Rho [Boseongicola sp. SB0677_bin_26]